MMYQIAKEYRMLLEMCKNNQFSHISGAEMSATLNFPDGCQSHSHIHSEQMTTKSHYQHFQ